MQQEKWTVGWAGSSLSPALNVVGFLKLGPTVTLGFGTKSKALAFAGWLAGPGPLVEGMN